MTGLSAAKRYSDQRVCDQNLLIIGSHVFHPEGSRARQTMSEVLVISTLPVNFSRVGIRTNQELRVCVHLYTFVRLMCSGCVKGNCPVPQIIPRKSDNLTVST